MKPVVLVHGAWHGAWCFDRLLAELQARNIQASALDLPLAGTEGDIAAANQHISKYPGAVVMGHSYGGLVITHATKNLPVDHLVYLAALMPSQGENVNERVALAGPVALNEAMVANKNGSISIDPERAEEAFYHDCEPADVRFAIEHLRPQVLAPFPILTEAPVWETIDSTYIICSDDRALHTDLQQDFASRANQTIRIEAAHSPFLSDVKEIADILERLAN